MPQTDPVLTGETRDRISNSFAAQGLMTTLGARLVDIAPGRVSIEAPIRPETGQQQGFAHAGLSFSIGDSAAGYAALSLMPSDREVMTAEMRIHLLAPASGERLVAEGKVIRAGRRIMVVQSDVYAETGADRRHVALLTGSMVTVSL